MTRKKRQNTMDQTRARIVIIDDHPIVREGLTDLINREKDLVVCGQAEDVFGALKAIETLKPDLVTVDISLRETDGLELIKDIKVKFPSLPVLALSMHNESLYAERALRAGAMGYIMKQEATKKVVGAIRKVLTGSLYLSDKMMEKLVHKLVSGEAVISHSPSDFLTDRELEVFSLLGRGLGTRQISEQLHLSMKTIETYRSRIKQKLNISSASELQQHAFQWTNNRNNE